MKKNTVLFILFAILLNSCTTPIPILQETQAPIETEAQALVESREPPAVPTDTLTPAPTPTYAPVKIKMNAGKSMSLAPIYLAHAEGYFADQNIEVEFVPFNKSTEAIPLLANGDLDVNAGSTDTALINSIAIDHNIAVVADKGYISPASDCAYVGILLRQDLFESGKVTRPSDLKGQTIAGGTVGASAYLMTKYLEQDGLTLKDIEMVNLPPASIAEAFTNKSIFASVNPEPWLATIAATGTASLWVKAQDVIPGFQVGVIAFGPSLIKNNPEAGVRFMVAYLKGVKQYQLGKTEHNLDILVKYTELLKEDLKAACWPPIREDGIIKFSGTDDFQKWAIEQGFLDNPVTEDEYWNPYFVEQAYAKLKQ